MESILLQNKKKTFDRTHFTGLALSHEMGFSKVTQNSTDEDWKRINEDHQILDDPQFTVSDVRLITGATAKAIEHMLDPKHGRVQLDGRHVSPGKGKRRMFTGSDILKINAAHVMSAVGFPQRWSLGLTQEMEKRAILRLVGLKNKADYRIITYPLPDNDWSLVPVYRDSPPDTPLPIAYQTLDVDRLIDETLAKLHAIVLESQVPDFAVPFPEVAPSPYSPENDQLRMWAKNDAGQPVLVGLDWKETQQYLHFIDAPNEHTSEQITYERFDKLSARHEQARLQRIGAEMEARDRPKA